MSNTTDTIIPTRRQIRLAAGTTEHAPSIAFALSDPNEGAARAVWIQLAKPGRFKGHAAGQFELSAQTFSQIIANFNAQENKFIPVDFEHASEQQPTEGSIPHRGAPAQGWITKLEMRADGNLWGLVQWGTIARDYIKNGNYKFLSPAIVFGAKDRVTGKPVGARLSSVALTNNPFLDGMQPVAAKRTEASEPAPDAEDRQAGPSPDVDAEGEMDLDPAVVALAGKDDHGQPLYMTALVRLQADADALTLRAETAETALEEANAKIAVFEEQDITALVDGAMSVWGERKGLTLADRPHLLRQARTDRDGFTSLYPRPVPGSQVGPHIGRLVAAGAHVVAPTVLHEQATAMSDDTPKIPSVQELADQFVETAKTKGVLMSREEAFSRAFTERQRLSTAARRAR